jgi:hypothetical protein
MYTPSTSSRHSCLSDRILSIAQGSIVLFCILFAANALARPYANLIDDARLYSAQVLNRAEHGTFQNDLFFRYGSQDQYSIFSILLAPLVNALGLQTAFFLVYLAGTASFIAALIRLVPRLVEDRLIAFLAMLYLVVAPLNYGGLYCLQVHEPFLTPRLLAVSLVLWGVDFLLQGRNLVSLVLMGLAGLVHPLIAVGGMFTWAGVFLVDRLGWRNCLFIAMGLLAAQIACLIDPPSSWRAAPMDDVWLNDIHSVTSYVFLSEWEPRDWVNVVVMAISLAYGIHAIPTQTRLFVTLGLLGLAAIVGTAMGNHLPYALLVQGQPYRSLWLLKVLQVPLCFILIDRLWRSDAIWKRALAMVLAAFFASTGPPLLEWTQPLYFLPFLLFFRGVMDRPRRPDWIDRAVAASMVMGQFAWMLGKEKLCCENRAGFLTFVDSFEFVHIVVDNFGVLPWILVIIGLLLAFRRFNAGDRNLAAVCLGIGLAVQLAFFVLPNTDCMRTYGSCYLPDVEFARDFISRQPATRDRPIAVYCAYGKVEYVWLELRANCYFDMGQTSGFIFNRQTAMEGKRRAWLVEPFEMAHYREFQSCISSRDKLTFQRFFKHGLDAPAPTCDDLVRLCWDKDEKGDFILDYAVLKHEFPGHAAGNGRVFVYDCREVRMNTLYHPARP